MNQNIPQEKSSHHLAHKLALILDELAGAWLPGVEPSFGQLRHVLGRHRVLILPSVKNHNEVVLEEGKKLRITVVLEVTLLDADSDDKLTTRWVGQALDAPEVCYEQAVTRALEDFLRKTFLFLPEPIAQPVAEPAIRRRPQGAAAHSEGAAPAQAQARLDFQAQPAVAPKPEPKPEPAQEVEPAHKAAPVATQTTLMPPNEQANIATPALAPKPQQDPEPTLAVNEDEDEGLSRSMLLADSKPWKAANALWRALVSEVCAAEVMEAYEGALEQRAGVDSWRKIGAEQLREWCHMLRRRSPMPSDLRKISDREEYILSHLEQIPAGSSLDRLEAELRRQASEAVDAQTVDAFMALYLKRMDASHLSEVTGRSAVALCRKLRRLREDERAQFILDALRGAEAEDAA